MLSVYEDNSNSLTTMFVLCQLTLFRAFVRTTVLNSSIALLHSALPNGSPKLEPNNLPLPLFRLPCNGERTANRIFNERTQKRQLRRVRLNFYGIAITAGNVRRMGHERNVEDGKGEGQCSTTGRQENNARTCVA